ncbi:hypothetical protein TMKG_02822, partial [Mycobacterium tuberculosis SUMu011]
SRRRATRAGARARTAVKQVTTRGRAEPMTCADDDAERSDEVGAPPACGGEWR